MRHYPASHFTGEVIEDQPETETEFGSGPETHNSHPVGRVSDAQGNALRHGAVAALAPEANLPSTGVIPSAGCTAPSGSAADEISESVQASSPEPIKAGALSSSLSVPAILSDEEVVPAFMKDKPGCLKLRGGHCKISFATEALCAECCAKAHISWKTHAANMADMKDHGTVNCGARNGASKLTDADVVAIRNLAGKVPQRSIADTYGVNQGTISDIIRRESWAHV